MMWLSVGFLSFFFWLLHTACGILVHQPGIEPGPRQWKCRVLTRDFPQHWFFFSLLYWVSTHRVGPLVLKFMGFSFEIFPWIFCIPFFHFLLFYELPSILMLGLNSSAEFPLLFHLFYSVQEVSSVFSSGLSYLIFNITFFCFSSFYVSQVCGFNTSLYLF